MSLSNDQVDELPQNIDVLNFRKHPNYTSQAKYNDLALLKLSRPVDVSQSIVMPLCLPDIGEKSSNDKYYVAGWGLFDETDNVRNFIIYNKKKTWFEKEKTNFIIFR